MIFHAKEAIAEHMKWRMRFQLAIECHEAIAPEMLQRIHHHHACPIGEWLLSNAVREYRDLPEFDRLVRSHLNFHREMARLAAVINERRFEEATRMLAAGSPFQQASQHIANAILAFDRARSPAVPARLQ